jgi:hypothetical protein
MLNSDSGPDSTSALERVIASAVDLTRAEASLALVRARVMVVKVMALLLTVMLAAAAAQVALLLVALSPVLFERKGATAVLFALVPALSLAGLGVAASLVAWRALKNAGAPSSAQGQP